ncbi:MAG: hypothetical protein ACREH3_05565, partial [Geminicoccales bacterium]
CWTAPLTGLWLTGLWLAALGLVGCTGDPSRAWQLAGQPGLLLKVQQYYESYGTEEGGRCSAPLLEGVARSEVLEDNPQQMVVGLTYYYRDWIRDGEDCSPLRPLRCTVMRECRGFASRTFTIDKGQDGLTVVGMSGGQRGRR